MDGNEWMLDSYKLVGETLSAYAKEKLGRPVHLNHGYPFTGMANKAFPIVWKHGALGPAGEMWNGGEGGRGECDLEAAAQWHHEHECLCSYSGHDVIMENGPISAIEEDVKDIVLKHKHMPKFFLDIYAPYWAPMEHIDAAIKAQKKYGRYE